MRNILKVIYRRCGHFYFIVDDGCPAKECPAQNIATEHFDSYCPECRAHRLEHGKKCRVM